MLYIYVDIQRMLFNVNFYCWNYSLDLEKLESTQRRLLKADSKPALIGLMADVLLHFVLKTVHY